MMKNPTLGLVLIISSLFSATATATADAGSAWYQTIPQGNKNKVKLNFYVHDVRTGPNTTLYDVASSSITFASAMRFNQINVFDDGITAKPNINSEEVVKAQGTTTSADLQVRAFAMNINFFITSEKFNRSTISIVGRNQFSDAQRELPMVGGTEAFQFARGY